MVWGHVWWWPWLAGAALAVLAELTHEVIENSLCLSQMEGSSNVLGLSVRVGNSMNCKIEAKEDGSWVMAGPAMTTQMMPPPEVYGEISEHYNNNPAS